MVVKTVTHDGEKVEYHGVTRCLVSRHWDDEGTEVHVLEMYFNGDATPFRGIPTHTIESYELPAGAE